MSAFERGVAVERARSNRAGFYQKVEQGRKKIVSSKFEVQSSTPKASARSLKSTAEPGTVFFLLAVAREVRLFRGATD
jgi:hypothetical protein